MNERVKFRTRASNCFKILTTTISCENDKHDKDFSSDAADAQIPISASNLGENDTEVTVTDLATEDLEQQCILLPTYAFRDQSSANPNEWTVRVRGWAYATRKKSRKRKLMIGVARRIMVKDEQEGKYLEDRFGMFLTKNVRNQKYAVKIIGLAHPSHMKLGGDPDSDDKSDSGSNVETDDETLLETESESSSYEEEDDRIDSGKNHNPVTHVTADTGHFEGKLTISDELVDEWISNANEEYDGFGNHMRLFKLEAKRSGSRHATPILGYADLIDAEGISIISVSLMFESETDVTGGAKAMLVNTFLKDASEVPGMAQRYLSWYQQGASIHYVSNSPWQLFPMLKSFFNVKSFPPGSAHLKLYNMKNITENTGENKKIAIRQILQDFPRRKFILIGDSGEIDMEIYASIVKEFSSKTEIIHVLIRDVTTKRLENQPAKRTRSLPFIPKRTSSANSFRTSKTMPNLQMSSLENNEDYEQMVSPDSEASSQVSTPSTAECEFQTPLEIFQERVQRIQESIEAEGTEFTLFTEGKELLGHAKIDLAFEELEKNRYKY
ncbi:9614_t:CDS:2 [Ambispora gerdemannii]|uniref:9614_t:CDS:1 n=1 Tax=Ambispora gerdemannii TaxID=144530 RepID=A0A9N8YIF0_9GLOM|nr:9614_t:CDS:2 [Ambispora gerdemannii]